METNTEIARTLVQRYRDDLEELTEAPSIEGYAAQEEIEDALNHLDAAIVDLNRAGEE